MALESSAKLLPEFYSSSSGTRLPKCHGSVEFTLRRALKTTKTRNKSRTGALQSDGR